MKKFFLIPLMAMLCTVMTMATVRTAGTFDELQNAISAAANGDEIKLTADIAYPKNGEGLINITKSITLDGQGHKISGYGSRGGQPNVIAINYNNSSYVTVELKNLDIYSTQYRPLETRGYLTKLTLDNVNITSTGGSSNPQGLTIGGTQTDEPYAQLIIKDSKISVGTSGYPVIFWNPTMVTAENSYFNGYCGLYFKSGSAQTVVDADNCNFDAPNVHAYADGWNNFGVFTMEDGNITLNLHNCGMNAQETGLANQGMLLPEASGCEINISGDNSHINGHMVLEDSSYPGYWLAFLWITADFSISGGTYSVDPSHVGPFNPYTWFGSQVPTLPNEDMYANFVPDGYEVAAVKQGDKTLYRVVKKAASYVDPETSETVLYDLNDYVPVEGVEEGNNPVSSFELSDGADNKTLNNEKTYAGYVEIKDHATEGKTVLTIDKTAGNKEQTLIINKGLDVQGESQVIVKAGATVQIGEGGINTEKPENIVIEADENGAASVLLDPTITVNQTPKLTVKMNVSKAGKDAWGDYWWHRFAMPVQSLDAAWTKSPNYGTYLYGWDYAENDWALVAGGSTGMVPWLGYTLTYDEPYDEDEVVTYTFQGPLAGNIDAALVFNAEGFNFFGNSYTGFIDALTLVEGLTDNNVRGTIYMWNSTYQTYTAVSLNRLRQGNVQNYEKEVAPMQTFILQLAGASSSTQSVNYSDAVWGNPRYGNTPSGAPARRQLKSANADDAFFQIEVKAENNQGDFVSFTQNSSLSDAYDDGWDAIKFMNDRSINFYSTIGSDDYTEVATDNIVGKTLTLKTRSAINYTLSFAFVSGNRFAIKDNLTGDVTEISESNTYSFTAQPDATLTDRFEIVDIETVVTAVENVESKSSARGIYTVLGQYVGENSMWNTLPAGVYVVDGVKLVK